MTEINTRVEHIDSSTRLFFSVFHEICLCVLGADIQIGDSRFTTFDLCVYIYEVLARGQLVQEKMVHTGEEQQTLSAM